jgi:beta-galactosidase
VADTYLETSQLAKGFVWINGHPLGRFWSVGHQKTLYLPGPWLNAGTNELVIFDLDGKSGLTVAGKKTPELDGAITVDPLSASAQ